MRKIFTILFILLCALACSSRNKMTPVAKNGENELYLLVGTYTSGSSKGIYVYRFDTESGTSEYVSEIKVSNPSYLTISSDERFVYAVGENGINEAAANAFSFDKKTRTLKFINAQLTKGAGPCYINTDNRLKSDGIAIFSINEADGVLKSIGYQPTDAHPRNFIITPNGNIC